MRLKLPLIAAAFCLSYGVNAQNGRVKLKNNTTQNQNTDVNITHRTCGTQAPGAEWDNWFNQKVEEFKNASQNSKNILTNYTIPVIVHVIHGGQAVGTFPNIQQGQINSQITVLNQDFAGTGYNNANLPSVFASTKANTGITFCLAQKDPNGVTLAEPGIERINYNTMGWANPAAAAYNTPTTFQNYINGTIKPNSIWDPTRYMNIWITDENANTGLLGYATFPAGTGLTGLSGFGTATTDGLWCWSKSFGSNTIFAGGTYDPTYNKGRTATHEIGHWVGLRHIGGDGSCVTDYCNDTPTQKGGFAGGQFGQNYGCPTHPYAPSGECSGTTAEMFMNFMDYTDDACMYMFTNDQSTRIQTAMANGTYRSQLSTSAATLCSISAAAPTASFSMPASGCTNSAVTVNNMTNGTPAPTYVWSSSPSSGVTFSPNNTATSPSISFATAGNYTITVAATNSLGSNSNSKPISITACSSSNICNDTLTNVLSNDTLFIYSINSGTVHGYVGGNNTYGDKEKAEYFSSTGLVGTSQVSGGIVVFYKDPNTGAGTKGTTGTVVFKLYNGNNISGPSGAPINTYTATLGSILGSSTATNHVNYCGNPNLQYNTNVMRPYSFNFPSPSTITGDFLLSVQLPTATGDTAVIFVSSEGNKTMSTAWELQTPSTWVPFNDGTQASWQLNSSLAILPKINCLVTGVKSNSVLDANISLHPNPSNGIINIVATLPNTQALDVFVHNSLGQLIATNRFSNVTNNVVSMDLSAYSNGVYFITINNGQEKIVKRIILNK